MPVWQNALFVSLHAVFSHVGYGSPWHMLLSQASIHRNPSDDASMAKYIV